MMHNSQNEVLRKCVRRLEECVPYLPIGLRTFVFENIREAQTALSTPPRNCERFDNANDAFAAYAEEQMPEPNSYDDWLFAVAKGATK